MRTRKPTIVYGRIDNTNVLPVHSHARTLLLIFVCACGQCGKYAGHAIYTQWTLTAADEILSFLELKVEGE
jgi:hypothetical protein